MPFFTFEGHRIAYEEFGGGPAAVTDSGSRGRTAARAAAAGRPLILVHGLLLDPGDEPAARRTARRPTATA